MEDLGSHLVVDQQLQLVLDPQQKSPPDPGPGGLVVRTRELRLGAADQTVR
jgi:hypothetical protein